MHQYEATRNGQAQVVLLSGEPGIGKTSILDDVATWAFQDGATVLRGGSSQAEGMPPYLPFLEALGLYMQNCPATQLEIQSATTIRALTPLFPELAARLENFPTSSPFPPEQARFRLYEAIGTFLESIGASHTLVLILDDLHWVDSASLDLLSHVIRRQRTARLLILGAYRDCEIGQNPALASSIAELSRQRVLTTIPVTPLSWSEIEALAERLLGGLLSSDMHTPLYTYSGGNPFFAEELLQYWIERKCLIQKQDRWIVVAPLDQALPPGIVDTLCQRFARLSPDCIDHLRVAAIIGRSFDLSLLATLKETTSEKVEECFIEAARSHLVRVEQTGTFTFSHDCVRAYLYADVSPSRRQLLHARIGSVLETRFDQGKPLSTYQLAQLAFHFARGDDRTRGSTYSERAGTRALEVAAAAEAVNHFRIAIDLLDPNDERRSDLLLQLSQALLLTDQDKENELIATSQDQQLRLALMLVEQAESEINWGKTECAEDLLKQALIFFEALDMAAYAQRVRNKLDGLVEQSNEVPKAVPFPSGLTGRQVMILKLVAQGKSNRQVAEELGLTVKTVSNHLTHIFNRTSCENRAAVTAFAFRQGLAW